MTVPLTPDLILKARSIARKGKTSTADIARLLGTEYFATYHAITGATHREVGGPLPVQSAAAKPCMRCLVLTNRDLCRWCRGENRYPELEEQPPIRQGQHYAAVLTREVVTKLYLELYRGKDLSLRQISRKEANGIVDMASVTLGNYFKRYGLAMRAPGGRPQPVVRRGLVAEDRHAEPSRRPR